MSTVPPQYQPEPSVAPAPGAAYYQPPQPGPVQYPPYPPPAEVHQQIAVAPPVAVEQPKSTTTTTIVINASGNCPKCLGGNIVETFSLAGICMAVWFFPCGLVCCLRWKHRFCDRCGAILS